MSEVYTGQRNATMKIDDDDIRWLAHAPYRRIFVNVWPGVKTNSLEFGRKWHLRENAEAFASRGMLYRVVVKAKEQT